MIETDRIYLMDCMEGMKQIRQLDQVTLFFIPIVSLEKQRGILCESCGMIVPLDKAEYKRRREARQKAALF